MGHIPVKTVKVADETIVLNVVLSVGTQIYNVATDKLYVLTDINTDTQTLADLITEGKASEIGAGGGGGGPVNEQEFISQSVDPGNADLFSFNLTSYNGPTMTSEPLYATNTVYGSSMSPDGQYLFVLRSGNALERYDLTVPYDITSFTTYSQRVTIADSTYSPRLFDISSDGIHFWVSGSAYSSSTTAEIITYELSVPWDLTTQVKIRNTTTSTTTNVTSSFLTDDGTRYYVYDKRYNLSTPWDMTTRVLDSGYTGRNVGNSAYRMSRDGSYVYAQISVTRTDQLILNTPYEIISGQYTSYIYYTVGNKSLEATYMDFDTGYLYMILTGSREVERYDPPTLHEIPANPTENNIVLSQEGSLNTNKAVSGAYIDSVVKGATFNTTIDGIIDLSNVGCNYYNFSKDDPIITTSSFLYSANNWKVGGRAKIVVSNGTPVFSGGINVGTIKTLTPNRAYIMTVECVAGYFRYWIDRIDTTDPSASSVYGTLEEGDIIPLNNTKGAYYNIQTAVDLSTITIDDVAIGSRAMIKVNQAAEPVIPPLPVPAVKLGAEVFIPNTDMMLTLEYNGDFVTYTYQILG